MKKYLLFLALLCLGLSACKKDEKDPPKHIYITSIVITKFEPTTSTGAAWDLAGGPDIYVDLVLGNSTIASSISIDDAYSTPTGWPALSSDFDMTQPTSSYKLQLWDYDTLDEDDLMATIDFVPFNSADGYPETIELGCASCELAATLHLEYEF